MNPFDMCWTTRIGAGKAAETFISIDRIAAGPPVEAAMPTIPIGVSRAAGATGSVRGAFADFLRHCRTTFTWAMAFIVERNFSAGAFSRRPSVGKAHG